MPQTLQPVRDRAFSSGAASELFAGRTATLLRAQDSRLSAEFDQTLRSKHALTQADETVTDSPRSEGARNDLESSRSADAAAAAEEELTSGDDAPVDEASEESDEVAGSAPPEIPEGVEQLGTGNVATEGIQGGEWGGEAAATVGDPQVQASLITGTSVRTAPVTIHSLNQQLLRGLLTQARGDLHPAAGQALDGLGAGRGGGSGSEAVAGGAPAGDPPELGERPEEVSDASTRATAASDGPSSLSASSATDTASDTPNDANQSSAAGAGASSRGDTARAAEAAGAGVRESARASTGVRVAAEAAAAAHAQVTSQNNASSRATADSAGDRVGTASSIDRPVSSSGVRGEAGRGAGQQGATDSRGSGVTDARTLAEGQDPRATLTAQLARGLSAAIARSRQSGAEGGAAQVQELTLRLQPAALGRLRIHVSFDRGDGKVSARFDVGSRGTKAMVAGSLEQLRQDLQARGLSVTTVEVGIDRSLASPVPTSADPLGLLFGTPSADGPVVHRALSDAQRFDVNPDAGGSTPDSRDASADLRFAGDDQEQHGPEARDDLGRGSTDAPSTPSTLAPHARGDHGHDAWNASDDELDRSIGRIAERLAERLTGDGAAAADVGLGQRPMIDAVA